MPTLMQSPALYLQIKDQHFICENDRPATNVHLDALLNFLPVESSTGTRFISVCTCTCQL